MGRVWLARDELSGTEVALKEVRLDTFTAETDRKSHLSRAWLEALHALSVAKSSNIVKILDVFEEGGRPWIVMELVIGKTLGQAVAEHGRLPPLQVAHIGQKVLMALTACHVKQIIHRDVKPSNILLADDGRVLLTDFGIAAGGATHEAAMGSLTPTGIAVGTPEYMAPERVKGRPATSASDLFSLGATLYFAVEGRSPFGRDSFVASSMAVLFESASRLQHGQAFDQLLSGLLTKDPAERTQTAEAYEQLMQIIAFNGAIPFTNDLEPSFGQPAPTPSALPPRIIGPSPAEPAPDDRPFASAPSARRARPWRAVSAAAVALAVTVGAALAISLFLLKPWSTSTAAPPTHDTPTGRTTVQSATTAPVAPQSRQPDHLAESTSAPPGLRTSVQCVETAGGVALKASLQPLTFPDIRFCLPPAARPVLQAYPIGTCLADLPPGSLPQLSIECGGPVNGSVIAHRLAAVWLASSLGGGSPGCQGTDITQAGGETWTLWTDGVVWSLCGIGTTG